MIIKIVRYGAAAKGAKSPRSAQRISRATGLQLARYIVAGEKLDLSVLDIRQLATNVHGDNPSVLAANAGAYVTSEIAGQPGRIASIESSHLSGGDPEDWIDQMAWHAEAAGIDRLYHIIYSHRPEEPVTPAMMSRHRAIIRQVMNLSHSPGLGAMHGDEDHDHFHDLVVAVHGPDGRKPQVGQGWLIEAAHIATAMCEYTSRLEPEPMRRYVADETGVYHFLTDTRVADANGRIVLDRKAMRTMQIKNDKMVRALKVIGDFSHQLEWSNEQILDTLVRPRIKMATNWDELHRNLARIGVRYVVTGNTARVEFHDPKNSEKAAFGLSSFYPRAALGKLEDRFEEPFSPAPNDLWVRPFVAPRFEQDRPDLHGKAERAAAREEARELEAYRTEQAKADRAALNAAGLRGEYNAQSKRLADADRAEKAAIKAVKDRTVCKGKTQDGISSPKRDGFDSEPLGILWGDPDFPRSKSRRKETEEEDELERRYRIKRRTFGIEYWHDEQIAFVAYRHTIAVHSRDKQARLDALRLAERKFGVIRVNGDAALKAEMIALALEHGIRISPKQVRAYERQLEAQRKRGARRSALEPEPTLSPEPAKRVNFARLRPKDVSERKARDRRIRAIDAMELRSMRIRNEIEDDKNKAPNPKPTSLPEAMRTLDRMNRDTMLLASSRYDREGIRFLDDEVLMATLGSRKHAALRPDLQRRLEAIALIHVRKRETICAALRGGKAKLEAGALVASDEGLGWAAPFFAEQKFDPVLQRMIVDALDGHIDLTHVDVSVRPELAVWREARKTSTEPALANAVATELFLTTTPDQRNSLFKVMSDDEGNAFRATPGHIAEAYPRTIYRGKGESDRSWQHRQRNAARIWDPRTR